MSHGRTQRKRRSFKELVEDNPIVTLCGTAITAFSIGVAVVPAIQSSSGVRMVGPRERIVDPKTETVISNLELKELKDRTPDGNPNEPVFEKERAQASNALDEKKSKEELYKEYAPVPTFIGFLLVNRESGTLHIDENPDDIDACYFHNLGPSQVTIAGGGSSPLFPGESRIIRDGRPSVTNSTADKAVVFCLTWKPKQSTK